MSVAALARAPAGEVLRRLGVGVSGGRWWCPLCQPGGANSHKTPDLVADGRRPGRWTCYRCGAHGDAIDLVRQVLGLDYRDAVAWIDGGAVASPGPPRPPRPAPPELGEAERIEVLEAVASRCALTPAVLAYAWSRGWTEDDLEHVGATAGPPVSAIGELVRAHGPALCALGLLDSRGRWAFSEHPLWLPFFDANMRIVYLQGRRIDDGEPRYRCIRGRLPCVWGLHFLVRCFPPGHPVYLCEGVPDAITIMSCDRARVAVALLGASTPTADLLAPLLPYSVIVAGDADDAGQRYNARCVELLRGLGCRDASIATPPPGCKDMAQAIAGGAP